MTGDFPANPREKAGYTLEFHDEFDSETLDTEKWIPYYLPQWSSREQSAPRYSIENNQLILQIEADQQPWCPEFDGDIKCSSLQTGLFAGEVGSSIGQHQFKDNLIVREAQPILRAYTPQFGYFETRIKATRASGYLCALWMIGFEEAPEESGEICMFEVFGEQMTDTHSEVRYGIHPFGDTSLTDEFYKEMLPIDATDFHIYAVEWTPTHVDFYVDNIKRKTIQQSPHYPMQFMLNIYELADVQVDYPVQFVVDYFRGYQPNGGYTTNRYF